jgi:flagellar FliL protein
VSTKPAETAAAPPKSKKMLLIVVVLVLVLALGGVGAFLFISKQRAAAYDNQGQPQAPVHKASAVPPVYLPLDNMVVNLADPGGERVAQVGITFELRDAAAAETVKQYLPTIRSGVLLLISQKKSEEMLQREGKEKLANDILREAARPFGGMDDEEKAEPSKNSAAKSRDKVRPGDLPVQRVLFSSFIVQ